jgi:hypothetical protein
MLRNIKNCEDTWPTSHLMGKNPNPTRHIIERVWKSLTRAENHYRQPFFTKSRAGLHVRFKMKGSALLSCTGDMEILGLV